MENEAEPPFTVKKRVLPATVKLYLKLLEFELEQLPMPGGMAAESIVVTLVRYEFQSSVSLLAPLDWKRECSQPR